MYTLIWCSLLYMNTLNIVFSFLYMYTLNIVFSLVYVHFDMVSFFGYVHFEYGVLFCI